MHGKYSSTNMLCGAGERSSMYSARSYASGKTKDASESNQEGVMVSVKYLVFDLMVFIIFISISSLKDEVDVIVSIWSHFNFN